MSLELNTRIGDPTKLGRDCEIHQHKQVKYSFTICYIRMIVFVDIIQISMFYNDISYSHWFPDARFHICDIVWYPDSISSKILLICWPFLVKHSLFHSQRPNIAGVERSIHQYAVIYRSPAVVITNEQLYHWQSDIIPIRTRSALKTKGTNRMIMCTYVVHKWAWKRSMQNTTALPWLFYHADMLTMQTWSK